MTVATTQRLALTLIEVVAVILTAFSSPAQTYVLRCANDVLIPLRTVELKIVLLEPLRVRTSSEFAKFLREKRQHRLRRFRDIIGEGFKDAELTMFGTRRTNSDQRSLSGAGGDFSCLYGPFSAVKRYVLQRPVYDAGGGANTLLGVALAAQELKKWRETEHDVLRSAVGLPFLEVFVLLADHYEEGSETSPNPFRGDGTDTCASGFPTHSQVKTIFSKAMTAFIFVTPTSTLREQWGKTFGIENALLYPNLEHERLYNVSAEDRMALFVRERVHNHACRRYQQSEMVSYEKDPNAAAPIASSDQRQRRSQPHRQGSVTIATHRRGSSATEQTSARALSPEYWNGNYFSAPQKRWHLQ